MNRWLGIAAAGLLVLGSAHASPILVDPTTAGSSVNVQITSSNCLGCFIDASLSGGLNASSAWLNAGDSLSFDFFDIVLGGLIGGAEIAVNARLALSSPDVSAQGAGFGAFASFLYGFNGVQLTWSQPGAIDLGDGTFLGVSFENLYELVIGNTTTVSATVYRYDAASVPEPGTTALLGVGLLALWFASRRRPIGHARFSASTA